MKQPKPMRPICAAGMPLVGLGAWCLLALAAWCFSAALTGPFVFDDFPNLQNLEQLQGRLDRSTIGLYLFSFIDSPGRPLAALSFLIEDANWPASPADFKRDNLLLHLLVGCLVFLLARALARMDGTTETKAGWISLTCCAMWLLHPMQLSATMLVVQRMTILSTLFVVIGLLLYVRLFVESRNPGFWHVALAGLVLSAFALIAFFCKENGVLIFAYASALNLTLLAPSLSRLSPGNRKLLAWGTASPILLLGLIALLRPSTILDPYAFRDFTLSQRLLTECRVLMEYLATIVWPRIGGQSVFHDDYVVSRSLLDPVTTLPALLMIVGLLGFALRLRHRAPLFAFAVLWFFAGHLIESTIIALELYFEHRNYLPMVGPLFALASTTINAAPRYRMAALALLALWLSTAAFSTRINARIWGDRGALAAVWLHERPQSVRSVQMLASFYADTGRLDEARATLDAGADRIQRPNNLRLQRVLLDCIDRGISRAQWTHVLDAAVRPHYDRSVPDLTSSFVRQATGPACHGTLARQDARELGRRLLANPAYADGDSQGFLHYELSRLSLADKDLEGLMYHMDLSNQHRPNPLVAREQAIYLLTAGLPEDALRYLDESERSRIPAFKHWLLDMPARNRSLRLSAERMLEAKQRKPATAGGRDHGVGTDAH